VGFHRSGLQELDLALDELIAEFAGLDHDRLPIASDLFAIPHEYGLESV
jgi:hypothetical protein